MSINRALLLCMTPLVLALALSACSSEQADGGGQDAASAQTDSPSDIIVPIEKAVRLGSSSYTVTVSGDFSPLRISNAEWEDDMKLHFANGKKTVDFSIYQFSKDGYADALEEFIQEEAKDHDAYEVKTDLELNGLSAAYYRSTEEYNEKMMKGMTFALDVGEEYLEVDFWFTFSRAEDEAWKIMNSLQPLDSESLQMAKYQIQLPSDFYLRSVDEEANTMVYQNGSQSLCLYIRQEEAADISLSDFVLGKGGSDVEADVEVNGIPAAMYRSEEISYGAYCSFLNCVLPYEDGFVTLSFCLNGISAEEEARGILATLTS